MTKQLINIGTIANDKTGDPLRIAFGKINTNITELYNALGNGTSITLTASATELNYVDGVTSNIQQQLDNKLNATVLAQVARSNSYSDLDNKPSLSTVAITGSYTDLTNKPSLFSGNYNDLIDKPNSFSGVYQDLIGVPQLATVAFTGSYNDLSDRPIGGSGAGLQSRVLAFATATGVADTASEFLNIAGSRGYVLYKISSSVPAWIRIYVNTSKRNADVSRLITADPASDAGVIAEVITTSLNETVYLTPGVIGFNDEGTLDTDIYVTVTNLSGSTSDITVSLTHVAIEQ